MSHHEDYWKECIAIAAEDCDLKLTSEQLECLAESAQMGHEHYGMAFYSPPDSDRISSIESEWKAKYKELEKELAKYQQNAETAIKKALKCYSDSSVSIGDHGQVFCYAGDIVQIQ